jgi:signal peptidase I
MLLKVIVGAAVAVLAFAIVVGDPDFKRYRIPSESMEPTVDQGETISADGGGDLKVGDVVIFNAPERAEQLDIDQCPSQTRGDQACDELAGGRSATKFIKRIVAGPGDEIAFKDGRVILNGKPQKEPYVRPCDDTICNLTEPITVKEGSYYLVGDNRGASDDSRFWGPVPEDWILGRVERCRAVYFFCSPV